MFSVKKIIAGLVGLWIGMTMPLPHYVGEANANDVVPLDILNPPYTVGTYHDFREVCTDYEYYYEPILEFIDSEDYHLALHFSDVLVTMGICEMHYPDRQTMFIDGIQDYGLSGNFYFIVYELKYHPDDDQVFYTMVINPFEGSDA